MQREKDGNKTPGSYCRGCKSPPEVTLETEAGDKAPWLETEAGRDPEGQDAVGGSEGFVFKMRSFEEFTEGTEEVWHRLRAAVRHQHG